MLKGQKDTVLGLDFVKVRKKQDQVMSAVRDNLKQGVFTESQSGKVQGLQKRGPG